MSAAFEELSENEECAEAQRQIGSSGENDEDQDCQPDVENCLLRHDVVLWFRVRI